MTLRWFGGRTSAALVYNPNTGLPLAGDAGTVWFDADRTSRVLAIVDTNQAPIADGTVRSDGYGYVQRFGIDTEIPTEVVWLDFTAGLGPLVAIECNDRATYRLRVADLPAAADDSRGVVELATPDEAVAGDDYTRAVTPAGVKAAILATPAPSGASGPDLVTPMIASGQPMFFAHRGAHSLYPENSLEGVRACIKDGFPAEVDLRILSTGQAVAIHDATIDRTMDGTGTVANMTLAQWRARRIVPQLAGGRKAMGAEWDQVLAEIGGRGILVPELNVPGTGGPMISAVVARGLQRAVIFQCDSFDDMYAVTGAGCACLMLVPTGTGVLSGITHAALRATGCEFIGYPYTVSQAEVNLAKAAGLKVIMYTVNTVAETTTQIAKGADGFFTDDPWHISGRYPIANRDPFDSGDAWPHLVGWDQTAGTVLAADAVVPYFQFAPPGKLRSTAGTLSKQVHLAMGWAGQSRGPNLRVRFTATFLENANSQTAWVGVFIGTQTSPDDVYHDAATAGQNGYNCFVRRNGQTAIYRVAPNTAAALLVASAAPGTPLAAASARSQPNRFEITISATAVTMTNLTSGLTVTNANTAFRGMSRVDLLTTGTDVEVEDIGVEEI